MDDFSLALCVDCGRPTIGGRGHFIDCKPEAPLNALERIIMAIAEEEEAD